MTEIEILEEASKIISLLQFELSKLLTGLQWLGKGFCQIGHFLSFYTDFYGPFSKSMGLWRMAPCLPNHWDYMFTYIFRRCYGYRCHHRYRELAHHHSKRWCYSVQSHGQGKISSIINCYWHRFYHLYRDRANYHFKQWHHSFQSHIQLIQSYLQVAINFG